MAAPGRNLAKAALRIGLSGLALYFVFRQIDFQLFTDLLRSATPLWLVVAVILYAVSKVVSAFRLNQYFRANEISLSENVNLRLYWVGMFYNLFLPGGIGGDAYKVWLLHSQGAPTRKVFQSVFFDRLSGLYTLGFLGLVTAWFSFPEMSMRSLLFAAAFMILAGGIAVHYVFARSFVPILAATTLYALAVQVIQLLCAWALLQAVGVTQGTWAYLTVFLVSSAVSVLPISIGGVGIRELVFITATAYAPLAEETAVAFSMIFFLVTVVSSLPGAWIKPERLVLPQKKTEG